MEYTYPAKKSGDAADRGSLPRLPGAALAGLYLAFCASALVLASFREVAPLAGFEAVGAGLGLVALAAMSVQLVTSGRFDTVSGRLGIDRIMAFHKMIAWFVLAALLLHPLLYVLPTATADAALGRERLVAYLTAPHYRTGVIALAALALLVVGAALRERLPWRYETWRGSHLLLGVLAIGLGLHHAITVGRFSAGGPAYVFWWGIGGGAVLVLGVLHGLRWVRLHRRPWRLASVTKRADRLWELDIQPQPGTPPLAYRAGQFVWMTQGRGRVPLLDHPFSIADSPLRPGLSLIVKEAGDFTRRVGALAPGTPIGIDGPYGTFTVDAHPGETVLLVAGGAGIGPIMGLLRDLAARGDRRPVRLAYAAGRPATFACLDEIASYADRLDLAVLLVAEEGGPGWAGEVGRLDAARLRALLAGREPESTVAFICGPGPMVTSVSDTLEDIGLAPKRVVYERFDYGGGATSRQDRRHALEMLGIGAALAALVGVFAVAA
ncbi:ferredoxin reductase family protein [Salinarimonas ramus]|uniref:Ferric reductase n=1 Tax=Salinarimonas ramus TaxID=690164 RepID=A0A917QDP8_9HYPH|nr:ferric reductase-like transmembrane domain-containing protein [Salinarimonas ramus]GGK45670.1 ferric reductase [Salinarimonas ramus]